MASDSFNPPVGVAEPIGSRVRRILAPNPSPMTYRGTNTYLLGDTGVAVIDPGPDQPEHLAAILRALTPAQRISHIFVTHSHVDHSPLARALSQKTGAPVLAYGPSGSGRSQIMTRLANEGLEASGEGIDPDFAPDLLLENGQTVIGADWSLTSLWTPGHLGNHMCFQCDEMIFSGDLVMGWASSLISPPDGDLTDFMSSCRRLLDRQASVFHAGHGAPIENPAGRLNWVISHRQQREAAILAELENGPATTHDLAQRIYTDTPPALRPAAQRNILAHLIDLLGKNTVQPVGKLSQGAEFQLV